MTMLNPQYPQHWPGIQKALDVITSIVAKNWTRRGVKGGHSSNISFRTLVVDLGNPWKNLWAP